MTEHCGGESAREAVGSLLDRLDPLQTDEEWIDGRVLLFGTTRTRVQTVVDLLTDREGPPVVLVADADATPILNRRVGSFETATRASDLLDAGTLELRETELPATPPDAVGHDRVGLLGSLPLTTTVATDELSDDARTATLRLARRADSVEPSVPGMDAITSGLASAFDDRVATDFAESVDTNPHRGDDLDGLKLLLLVAAVHRLRWNDLRETADELGIASAKPLRKRKRALLDAGWILERPATEDDDPGRPPNVLTLPDRIDVSPGGGLPDLLARRAASGE